MARHQNSEQGSYPYRYTDGEAFENVPRLVPSMMNSVPTLPSPPPSHFSSWHAPPSEVGFVLDTPTSGSQASEQQAYANVTHDFACHGGHGQDYRDFPPSRGYESRAPQPPSSAPPQFNASPRATIDPFIPGSTAYPIVYTDDTTVKLTSRVRRQCFNCNSKATTTWRRSMLMFGKWVCNKCGLFERAHSTPRPKAFPRRRRSRSPPASGYPNPDAPLFNHFEYRHHDDHSSTGHFPSPVDTNPQNSTWMTNNVPSTPTRLDPAHIVSPQPRTYRAGSHLPFSVPSEPAYPSGSHLGDRRLPM